MENEAVSFPLFHSLTTRGIARERSTVDTEEIKRKGFFQHDALNVVGFIAATRCGQNHCFRAKKIRHKGGFHLETVCLGISVFGGKIMDWHSGCRGYKVGGIFTS